MTFNRKIFSNPNPHPREIEFNPKPKQHEPIILEIGNNISRTIFYKNLKNGGGRDSRDGKNGDISISAGCLLQESNKKEWMLQCNANLIKPGWAGGFKEEKDPQQYLLAAEHKVVLLRREAWLCFHLIGLIETRRMSLKCISTGCHAELLNSSDLLIYSTFAQL